MGHTGPTKTNKQLGPGPRSALHISFFTSPMFLVRSLWIRRCFQICKLSRVAAGAPHSSTNQFIEVFYSPPEAAQSLYEDVTLIDQPETKIADSQSLELRRLLIRKNGEELSAIDQTGIQRSLRHRINNAGHQLTLQLTNQA